MQTLSWTLFWMLLVVAGCAGPFARCEGLSGDELHLCITRVQYHQNVLHQSMGMAHDIRERGKDREMQMMRGGR